MSKSKGTILNNLSVLLRTVDDNLHRLPDVRKQREELADALARASRALAERDSHRAQAQGATQELHVAMAQAKEAASSLRTAAVLMLGRRSEALAEFQVKPLR